MTTKIIHFTVGGKKEQAEFWSDDSSSDVKGNNFSPFCVTLA